MITGSYHGSFSTPEKAGSVWVHYGESEKIPNLSQSWDDPPSTFKTLPTRSSQQLLGFRGGAGQESALQEDQSRRMSLSASASTTASQNSSYIRGAGGGKGVGKGWEHFFEGFFVDF